MSHNRQKFHDEPSSAASFSIPNLPADEDMDVSSIESMQEAVFRIGEMVWATFFVLCPPLPLSLSLSLSLSKKKAPPKAIVCHSWLGLQKIKLFK